MQEITVVGGGLSGLVAAVSCAEAGAPVRLVESHQALGGRGRSLGGPYVANEGTRVFYADGPTWAWLRKQRVAEPAVRLGPKELRRFRFRRDGRLVSAPPTSVLRPLLSRHVRAPVDRDFRTWASERFSDEATRAIEGLLGVVTYTADVGGLSAAFVWERFMRATRPAMPAPRYVVGGWQAVIERLERRARALGVRIETGVRVEEPPAAPVIVATHLASARRLLGDAGLTWPSGRSALLDVGIRARPGDAFVVADLDEGAFVERYSLPDPSLAPEGHSLVQAQMPVRRGEGKQDALERLAAVLDLGFDGWRDRVTWRREGLANGRTGALDLPGLTWRDRPAVDRGDGTFLAGDQVAAPGLLSEVGFTSARWAARSAVEAAARRRRRTDAA